MQNCPRQLAMQSCVLCSFVRCGSSKQIEKEKKRKKKALIELSIEMINYWDSNSPSIIVRYIIRRCISSMNLSTKSSWFFSATLTFCDSSKPLEYHLVWYFSILFLITVTRDFNDSII